LIWVELVTGDYSGQESAETDLSIVEIETEKGLGEADALGGSYHISKVLEEVQSVIELALVK
jgi:hypothetical protein